MIAAVFLYSKKVFLLQKGWQGAAALRKTEGKSASHQVLVSFCIMIYAIAKDSLLVPQDFPYMSIHVR
jgi:hypothetical protein